MKAVRFIPLNQQVSGETANHIFKFMEDFSRAIGIAKADVAAREFAVNNEPVAQPSDSNQAAAADPGVHQLNHQQAPANNEADPIPPAQNNEPVVNFVEIADRNDQVLVNVFGDHPPEEPGDEDDDIHDNIEQMEFNDDYAHNMEDDYEDDEMHDHPPRSGSSSSESNEGDHHPIDEHQPDEHIDEEPHTNERANNGKRLKYSVKLNLTQIYVAGIQTLNWREILNRSATD